jgi:hypothetical protein
MPFDFILDYLLPIETTVKPFFGMFAIYYREKLLLILRERNNQPGMNGIWIATNGSGFLFAGRSPQICMLLCAN